MKVSFVIPAFNSERYLDETLQSIKDQTVKPHEIVLVNDGSTDHTVEIAMSYGCKIVNNQVNRGIGVARQRGALASTGSHVAYLSSDDYLLPDFLEKCTHYIERDPGRATFTHFNRLFQSTGAVNSFDMPPNIEVFKVFYHTCINWAIRKNMIVNFSTVIIPRSWFDALGFLPLRTGEDLIFLLDSLIQGFRWRYVPHRLLYYRVHSGQYTKKQTRKDFYDFWDLLGGRLLKLGVTQDAIDVEIKASYWRVFPTIFHRVYWKIKSELGI